MPTDPSDTGTPTGPRARPIWFPVRGEPCAAWVHDGAPGGAGGAVLLCPSVGLETEASQRAFRALAPVLAAGGRTVLRIDYLGCGDSGDLPGVDRGPELWIETVRAAADLVRSDGPVDLSVVGIRLGALLAAAAGIDPVAVVHWYPSASGKTFLRHQVALRNIISPAPEQTPDHVEVLGMVLTTAGADAVRGLPPLTPPDGDGPPTLVVSDAGAASRWEGSAATVVANPDGAHRLFGVEQQDAAVDPDDVARIVGHLDRHHPGPGGRPHHLPGAATWTTVRSAWGVTARERPRFLTDDGLFAVETAPAGAGDPPVDVPGPLAYDAAVFLNAVDLPHTGPGREWVDLARRFAGMGMRSLRLDIHGVGDSAGPPWRPGDPDDGAAAADVLRAVAALSTGTTDRTLLVGFCSGAARATAVASLGGIRGVCFLNPSRLPAPATGRPASREAPDAWTTAPPRTSRLHQLLKRPGISGRTYPQRIARVVPDPLWRALNALTHHDPPIRQFRALVAMGVHVHVICGPDDGVPLGRGTRGRMRRLARTGRFTFDVVPSLDHNLHSAAGRREAMALLRGYVTTDGATGRRPGPR